MPREPGPAPQSGRLGLELERWTLKTGQQALPSIPHEVLRGHRLRDGAQGRHGRTRRLRCRPVCQTKFRPRRRIRDSTAAARVLVSFRLVKDRTTHRNRVGVT